MIRPVVVGSASRDLSADDPRGWRLGGPAAFAGLVLARLGLRPRVLLGVDRDAAGAQELMWLRDAGAELQLVSLAAAPVFDNVERPTGRLQVSRGRGADIPVAAPRSWSDAGAWLLLPVMGELSDGWASVPPADALVVVGWQGLLRDIDAANVVVRHPPGPSPFLARAAIVGVSRFDLAPDAPIPALAGLLAASATLYVTDAERGGLIVRIGEPGLPGRPRLRRYPAIPAARVVDPTGAGDAFLAGIVAARLGHPLAGSGRRGGDARLAAAVASLVVEAPGLAGVPDLAAVSERLRSSLDRRPAG